MKFPTVTFARTHLCVSMTVTALVAWAPVEGLGSMFLFGAQRMPGQWEPAGTHSFRAFVPGVKGCAGDALAAARWEAGQPDAEKQPCPALLEKTGAAGFVRPRFASLQMNVVVNLPVTKGTVSQQLHQHTDPLEHLSRHFLRRSCQTSKQPLHIQTNRLEGGRHPSRPVWAEEAISTYATITGPHQGPPPCAVSASTLIQHGTCQFRHTTQGLASSKTCI